MAKKKDVPTQLLYVDIKNHGWSTRELAIQANRKHREEQIEYSVVKSITEVLEKVDAFKWVGSKDRPITLNHVAKYLLDTDLIKAHSKIGEFLTKAEKDYKKDYPNSIQE